MRTIGPETNIVLIGMPGVGKSTIGVLLAKATSRAFIDTDVYIQSREKRRLQDLLDAGGRRAFCRLESRHIRSLRLKRHVIATGGSAVYSPSAMRHLKRGGVVVLLDLPCAELERRLKNMDARGVVMEKGQTVCALYAEREPLYRKYADVVVECAELGHEQVASRIMARVWA